ncbi:MAG TPA: DUF2330 domain-containing protein [Bacteroidia bacterium]|nr:DUF2330 domain-containing protein [Bacteroidia bacterium]
MKKIVLSITSLLLGINGFTFCGFYVAKADTKLFNKTSQVIICRDGDKSTITMSSDFEGNVKDFAMVVPVPVVLEQKDIRVVDRLLFDKLDAYSSPRLVEYYDNDPCYENRYYDAYPSATMNAQKMEENEDSSVMTQDQKYHVTIEAKYTVGEYDILILSAKESGGLEMWLTDNGYKIPEGAKEVLEPYIKSNMKFFVAKVNLGEYTNNGAVPLRPLQIEFSSPKFMLPIRLGMANSDGVQDMIVYAFSKVGRIETTNYRTVEVPTDMKVPLFVANEFGQFYKDLYDRAWKREDKDVVFLEYAWEVSPMQNVFCDPCVGDPPMVQELKESGVTWLTAQGQDYHTGGNVYAGNVYFTRLHVTYDRTDFPQDLMFQETPNKAQWQARYILTHPASGQDFSCTRGQDYLYDLRKRRWDELYTYQWLTGHDITKHMDYPVEFNKYIKKKDPKDQGEMIPYHYNSPGNKPDGNGGMMVFFLSLATLFAIGFSLSRNRVERPSIA